MKQFLTSLRWPVFLGSLLGTACEENCSLAPCPPPAIVVQLVDATTGEAVVDAPIFSADGALIPFYCADGTSGNLDAGGCSGWFVEIIGAHTVNVQVFGYAPTNFSIDTGTRSDNCCPDIPDHGDHIVVRLHRQR